MDLLTCMYKLSEKGLKNILVYKYDNNTITIVLTKRQSYYNSVIRTYRQIENWRLKTLSVRYDLAISRCDFYSWKYKQPGLLGLSLQQTNLLEQGDFFQSLINIFFFNPNISVNLIIMWLKSYLEFFSIIFLQKCPVVMFLFFFVCGQDL